MRYPTLNHHTTAAGRFTPRSLAELVAAINTYVLHTHGHNCPFKLESQGRNNYQAVDLYFRDDTPWGSCLRNISCGTSREVANDCLAWLAGSLPRDIEFYKETNRYPSPSTDYTKQDTN